MEGSTCVATMAQKPLATEAVNLKLDRCNRFSECQTLHPTGLNCKKVSDLLCVVS